VYDLVWMKIIDRLQVILCQLVVYACKILLLFIRQQVEVCEFFVQQIYRSLQAGIIVTLEIL
jgi:hypothetical protein